MKYVSRTTAALLSICVVILVTSPCFAMISVGVLAKEKAKTKYGITMHARQNGEAGIKVWLEFKKEGWLKSFTYAELRMEDPKGKHLLSVHLSENPHHHRRPDGVTAVAFSADPSQLDRCSFLVVCYGSNEGDVGYYLKVKDFLDLENPITGDCSGGTATGSDAGFGNDGGFSSCQTTSSYLATCLEQLCSAYQGCSTITRSITPSPAVTADAVCSAMKDTTNASPRDWSSRSTDAVDKSSPIAGCQTTSTL